MTSKNKIISVHAQKVKYTLVFIDFLSYSKKKLFSWDLYSSYIILDQLGYLYTCFRHFKIYSHPSCKINSVTFKAHYTNKSCMSKSTISILFNQTVLGHICLLRCWRSLFKMNIIMCVQQGLNTYFHTFGLSQIDPS